MRQQILSYSVSHFDHPGHAGHSSRRQPLRWFLEGSLLLLDSSNFFATSRARSFAPKSVAPLLPIPSTVLAWDPFSPCSSKKRTSSPRIHAAVGQGSPQPVPARRCRALDTKQVVSAQDDPTNADAHSLAPGLVLIPM